MEHLTDDQLLDLIDGFASEAEKPRFEIHLAGCEDCQARYQTFTAINAQLASMPLLKPSVVFTERVLDQWDDIRLATATQKKRTARSPFVFLGVMGGILLTCFLILYWAVTPSVQLLPTLHVVKSMNQLAGNELFWLALISANALLLLWLFNQRILLPFFRQRMAV